VVETVKETASSIGDAVSSVMPGGKSSTDGNEGGNG